MDDTGLYTAPDKDFQGVADYLNAAHNPELSRQAGDASQGYGAAALQRAAAEFPGSFVQFPPTPDIPEGALN